MTDIVDRLRDIDPWDWPDYADRTASEAADTIEALRAQVAGLGAVTRLCCYQTQKDAARYRWLRHDKTGEVYNGYSIPEELDAAIDAALVAPSPLAQTAPASAAAAGD